MVAIAIGHSQVGARRHIRSILERSHQFLVVGEANDGPALIDLSLKLKPEIALVEASLPGPCLPEIVRVIGPAGLGSKVISVVNEIAEWTPTDMVQAGLAGCVGPDDLNQIDRAVEIVAAGGVWLSPNMVESLADQGTRERLSRRELEVLALLVRGLSDHEIAALLTLSAKTVRNHVNSIYAKLGVHNRVQAVTKAIRHRLVSLGGELLDKR